MPFRLDADEYKFHKMDPLTPNQTVHMTTKYIQKKDHFTVNGKAMNLSAVPQLPAAAHGDFLYNKTFAPNSWWWGNRTYNDTKVGRAGRRRGVRFQLGRTCACVRWAHSGGASAAANTWSVLPGPRGPLAAHGVKEPRAWPTQGAHGCFCLSKQQARLDEARAGARPDPLCARAPPAALQFTVFVGGRQNANLRVAALVCPEAGCGSIPDETTDMREGTLRWSNRATWSDAVPEPVAGSNVSRAHSLQQH